VVDNLALKSLALAMGNQNQIQSCVELDYTEREYLLGSKTEKAATKNIIILNLIIRQF